MTQKINQAQLADLPKPLLLDVREPAEFESERLPGSVNLPLSELAAGAQRLPKDASIVVICRSGRRSEEAARKLTACGFPTVLVHEGGLSCCNGVEKGAGRAWAMERQVRMAAGLLVSGGIALAWAVHPAFALLSAGVGLGLVYSAASDTCGMAMILARMPWNRRSS